MKFVKYIRKYLGCNKQNAAKLAEDWKDKTLREIKVELDIMKFNQNSWGLSSSNKIFLEERDI